MQIPLSIVQVNSSSDLFACGFILATECMACRDVGPDSGTAGHALTLTRVLVLHNILRSKLFSLLNVLFGQHIQLGIDELEMTTCLDKGALKSARRICTPLIMTTPRK
jgi:hypothetical protein